MGCFVSPEAGAQAKLTMMREALHKLDRKVNEHASTSSTAAPN
jgi:hypothetical protein